MKQETAVFAMGCFWCGESEFRDPKHEFLPGILSVRVGYTGGTQANPTYENHAGYKEAVKIVYNAEQIAYQDLLDIFWKNIDPLDSSGQFSDHGFSYTSAIYYTSLEQKNQALQSECEIKKQLNQTELATEILEFTSFQDAEEYHQDFKSKNPIQYQTYRSHCGRDKRLLSLWHTE